MKFYRITVILATVGLTAFVQGVMLAWYVSLYPTGHTPSPFWLVPVSLLICICLMLGMMCILGRP